MNLRHATRFALCLLTSLLSPLAVICAELVPYTEPDQPGFSLPDLNGQLHAVPDYHGKVVLVNFWASWCPPCIYEMPELTRLKQHLADKPFEIIAINAGEKKYKVRKFIKAINLQLPVLLDTENKAFSDWGVKTLPTSFLIDANGKIRYRIRGNPGWENEQTITAIEKLITEKTASDTMKQLIHNEAK